MKGSIRILLGILVVFGAVGGMEHETASLLEGSLAAVVGLAIMAWGVSACNREQM
jgi:hypothetical protein